MSSPLAELEVVRDERRVVIRVTGEIDLSNVDELQEWIDDASSAADEVVIDLTEVGYMDSQGVRLLYRLSSRLGPDGVALVVVAPASSIAGEVLRITQTTDLISVRDAV